MHPPHREVADLKHFLTIFHAAYWASSAVASDIEISKTSIVPRQFWKWGGHFFVI